MSLLHSLTHPPFALLRTGQTVSRLGDSLFMLSDLGAVCAPARRWGAE